jgi:hypothetical protein
MPILLKICLLVLSLLATAAPPMAYAQSPTTPILIPTLYNGPGAEGSTWWSWVLVDNHSPETLSSPGVWFTRYCAPIPERCRSTILPAGEGGVLDEPRPAQGLLLHAPIDIASDLAFKASFGSGKRFFSTSSELPVARERDFSMKAIHFPSVPVHPSSGSIRSLLRIYGPDAQIGTRVLVELRQWVYPQGHVLAEREMVLGVPPSPTELPIYPAYADLPLQREFPFELLHWEFVGITVTPLPFSDGTIPRIWAFISTVDNETLNVEIQRPQ